MLNCRRAYNLALKLEDLLTLEGITDSAVEQRALNPLVSFLLPARDRLTKFLNRVLPPVDRSRIHAEKVSKLKVGSAESA